MAGIWRGNRGRVCRDGYHLALHMLNEASDLAVAIGYLILLAMLAAGVGLFRRYRRG